MCSPLQPQSSAQGISRMGVVLRVGGGRARLLQALLSGVEACSSLFRMRAVRAGAGDIGMVLCL